MLKELPKFKMGEFDIEYNKLSEEDKKTLEDYCKYCSINASDAKVLDMKRNVMKFRLVVNKEFDKIDLNDLRGYLAVLNKSSFSDHTKNDMKVHVKKLLRWKFKDWSVRFDEFNDIKQNPKPKRNRKIDEKTILTKEEVEKIMKTETQMYWKAFFITLYEGALRTKECRFLKWDDLNEEGDYYSINLHATKTKEDRPIVLKEAKFYLDKLRTEQKNKDSFGVYIFHAKKDVNKPINKSAVSMWMRRLSKKALGREIWAYILRHTRGSEYRKLVKEGKLSKDNATQTMGHSEKMFDKVYSHLDKNDIKEMIKEQIYNFEDLPPEKKEELEKQLEAQKKEIEKLNKMFYILAKHQLSKLKGKDKAEIKKVFDIVD